jgi:hypothetical protein
MHCPRMSPIKGDVPTPKMSDYVQHVVAELPPLLPTLIVKIECEKSGTLYWENTSTGERAWSKETLNKE